MDKQRTALIATFEQARDEAHEALLQIAAQLREGSSNSTASCAGEWIDTLTEQLASVGEAADAIRRLDFFDRTGVDSEQRQVIRRADQDD